MKTENNAASFSKEVSIDKTANLIEEPTLIQVNQQNRIIKNMHNFNKQDNYDQNIDTEKYLKD